MPSALSSLNDYYARHQRRQSSMSQTSLPDQLKNQGATAYSPSRSAVFLPSTIYTSNSEDRPLSPPPTISTTHVSALDPLPQMSGNDLSSSNDPDDYYRQHHSQHNQPLAVIQSTPEEPTQRHFVITSSMSPENVYPSQQQEPSSPQADVPASQRSQSAPRARKSSVKNRVAQINATSTDEIPPLPTSTISQPVSRSISPVMTFATGGPGFHEHLIPGGAESYHEMNLSNQHGLGLTVQNTTTDDQSNVRRPLFGEVLLDAPANSAPGFGILHMRHRSGSEGSPLIPDHAGFPRQSFVVTESTDHDTYGHPLGKISSNAEHRRVLSDSPVTPTSSYHLSDPFVIDSFGQPGNVPHNHDLQNTNPAASVSETKLSTTLSRSSPRRRQRGGIQIQSPGRARKTEANISSLQTSSSLQANIIAPPPKISPPLRSSRPRVPISSASTAASRARMVEKFNTMQKMHNEKRAADKRPLRPPELSDIDLKARRLRITQALSRSLEGHELRGLADVRRSGTSSTRTASPAHSDSSYNADRNQHSDRLPMISVHTSQLVQNESDLQPSGSATSGDRHYTQNALYAMTKSTLRIDNHDDDDDSPTLGRGDAMTNKPSPIQTNLSRTKQEDEPSSALTVGTEHTTIDPEPQSELYDPSRFDPLNPRTTESQHQLVNNMHLESPDDLSDRADLESVRLILRDTAYLDESEAIRTGYRTAQNAAEPLPSIPISLRPESGSWTSANEYKTSEQEDSRLDSNSAASDDLHADGQVNHEKHGEMTASEADSAHRGIDSNAYMIVNIVLQQHSPNGVVDQQFVDDVYQRILQTSPYNGEALDTNKIEQICLKELQDRENSWRKSIILSRTLSNQSLGNAKSPIDAAQRSLPGSSTRREAQPRYNERASAGLSPTLAKSHRYKSSLDSAEDWADTSPSVGDWMRFAVADEARKSTLKQPSGLSNESLHSQITLVNEQSKDESNVAMGKGQAQEEDPDIYAGSLGLASPPPPEPPAKDTPQVDQKIFGTLVDAPAVPQRLTSLTLQGDQTPPPSQSPAPGEKTHADDPEIAEQRQLKKRRHVIKELVDTEFSYEKDLQVLCNIYKQTAPAALTEDDIKVLFGNIEAILAFSKEFLTSLKLAARPAYVMDRQDRKKEKTPDNSTTEQPDSSSSTLASSKVESEVHTADKDRETRLGQAFEFGFGRMEKTYSEYIRNRQAANMRLEVIQKEPAAREWLKVCRNNSSDITNAWNLDALLVKPVQRITKYPLLLRELVESTSADHPDMPSLKHALHEVTEINIRINDVKKRTELVDQVFNRKRKDSEVRLGLSKAFGRRAEKLKQHLGTAEMYEDNKYNDAKIEYDHNIVQLMVVGHDCSSYGRAITKWVTKVVEIAAAAEEWVDVKPSNYPEAESRLRHFAMVMRGISSIALPDHLEQLETRVLNPMQNAVDLMNRFKNEPKGLLQKRDKRLIDYAQARNRRDKGEKVDKKMAERMEQWEALNSEAKQRMKKLVKATGVLVQHCRRNLLEMQMSWMKMVQNQLSNAMGVNVDKLEKQDIHKEWQLDFDFQEASALSLSICNGALLAEAVNMVSFQTPSTTLNGDDSPAFTNHEKRSSSMHSNGSHAQLMESLARTSGASNRQNLDVSQGLGPAFQSHRERPSSMTGSGHNRASDGSTKNVLHKRTSANRNEDRSATGAPRLSVDTPSPLIGSLSPVANKRPPSWSAFFSNASDHPNSPRHKTNGSGVFSSAMPMSDSSNVERHREQPPESPRDPAVLFTAASVYEFNIDRSRKEGGFPYLTYVTGEIFDIIGYNGELWLARNQDDAQGQVGWIWHKHFAKLQG